jgi:DNA-binding MarR family transcriptional regulator
MRATGRNGNRDGPERASIGTLYLISRTFHAARMHLEKTLRSFGVTGIQFTILDMLSRRRGLSAAELARNFFVSPQTMGEIVGGPDRRGLVERVESPENRRVLQIELSAAGRALLRHAEKQVARAEAEFLDGLDARSVANLRQLHFRLNAQLRAHAGKRLPDRAPSRAH